LVDYRSEFSVYADRTLGQHAISLADAMNVQNKKGIDGDGLFGQDLFSLKEIKIQSSSENISKTKNISVKVSDGESAKITTDTYELSRTDTNQFSIKKINIEGNSTEKAVLFDPNLLVKDSDGFFQINELGLDIRLADIDEIDRGDTFQFTPTELAAAGLELVAENGDSIALSSPLGVNTSSENLSDARASLTSVTNTSPETSAFSSDGSLYPSAPHKIYFTSPSSYVIQDASGVRLGSVDNVVEFTNLLEKAGLAKDAGFDVSVSSRPKRGDVFSFGTDNIGPSDNFNGLALAELKNASLIAGKTTLTKSFAGFISYVGSKTAEVEGHADSSEVVMNESIARRDRLSAVSLDEEAVNLLKYQQSYSASAQVVTAARTTFETLLGIMR
jgi:flagellar hook-associated protein 1 FlgK